MPKYRGYCYEHPTYVLPLLYMTEEEKRVLKFLAYRYRHYNYDNAEAVNRVGLLLSRFADGHETEAVAGSLPVFDAHPRLMQNFELLSHAIEERLIVRIIYRHPEEEGNLVIYPLKFLTHYNEDYVVAYCEQQNRRRSFRLESIEHVTVTANGYHQMAVDTLERGEGGSPVRKPFTASVRLSSPLNGKAWNGYPARSVGELLYEVEFYDTNSFLQHLLISEWQQLAAPKWLRAKFQRRCLDMLDLLNNGDE